jgi:hypothetical protein
VTTAMEFLTATCSEEELQDSVLEHAELRGWLRLHIRPARIRVGGRETYRTPVQGDGKGFPDNVFLRGERCVIAELKSLRGKVSDEQQTWLDAWRMTGAEVYVWTPLDVNEISMVLA